ncbi:Cysteine-rich_membrane protein 1 [Hexamita inflata]|uniref:Cysteine-rich membrane protein 1 n=1 Tax=Hexamita inflata TaxID=28002 RepID=A0AA86UU21_9EUKA|nr:Cysteine-rich membrane protein 1 [Hexamita inflata]
MIITFLSLQIASCGQNFTFSKLTNSCVCELLLSSNKSMCAETCEDFNEKLVNGKCVKQITIKGASNNIDCMTLYNQGSIWDGGSQCKCSPGYAGGQNSFCTDCKRLGQVVSGTTCAACPGNTVLQGTMCNECTNMVPSVDKLSCVTCVSRYGDGSIYQSSGTCVCDTTNGFAGATNSVCTDCWRKGQAISGTSCAACSGTTVLQYGVCSECPASFVPSVDKQSCISCSQKYSQGSIYSTINTCVCDSSNGFAGSSNSICSYCWVLGKTISGSSCASCSGTQVLQSGVCSECPANFIPSSDKLYCISCSQRFGHGSIYSAVGTCTCDSTNGFAGASNSICSYCWVLGKTVSGSSCSSCSGTTVLQSGTCQECPNNLVPSADKLSCVSCASRYGEASTFVSFGLCRCTAFGFAGSDNSVCSDCLRMGQMISGATCSSCSGTQVLQAGVCAECPADFVPSSDKQSCISCSQRYGNGAVYSSINSCICDSTSGFAGAANSACAYCWILGKTVSGNSCIACSGTAVLQSGVCSECQANFVPSADKLSCVTCASKFGDGSVFLSTGICRCSDVLGFAGDDNAVCSDCWRQGKSVSGTAGSTTCLSCSGTQVLQSGACADCPTNLVQSADKLSCVTCASLYGQGSSYSAINTCVCRVSAGFGGADNSICEDCKRSGKEASVTGCTACSASDVLQSGTCKACPAGSVPSLDKLSCVAQSTCQINFGPGSQEVTPGTCRCQSSSGFAGSDNQVCVDCIRISQFVSGTAGATTCAACPGTQVLQAGVCAECPANFVASSDKLSCITCSSKFGDGSVFLSSGICRCSDVLGFAGDDNAVCSDCWRQGKSVSGTAGSTTCLSCSGTQVLQSGACADCPTNLVQSADKLSCVTCASLYGQGSSYSAINTCVCRVSEGFGGANNHVCEDCKRSGKEASTTGCTACTGTQVLQSGACAECPAGSVQSADKLSCVAQSTCSTQYGPGSQEVTPGTCRCTASGFAGNDNTVCVDCLRIGKVVSGTAGSTTCEPCSGTEVLQSGSCSECPNSLVPSADKLSCVSCASRYGEASTFVSFGLCRCTAFGFAGSDNSVCSDCLRMGQMISGATCSSCSGTQVLQAGVCAECPADFVPSSDKQSCISCSQRYGNGAVYSSINSCICDSTSGFAGAANSACAYCWILGKTVSGNSCIACSGTAVLQSGVCSECQANFVPSADKLSCVTCASKFGDGSVFLSTGICRCSDVLGFAGDDNAVCSDCWRQGKSVSGTAGSTTCLSCSGTQVLQSGACADCPTNLVQSADKLSCVTCASLYGQGSSYSAINTCVCRVSEGFGGANNHVCEDCKRSGKEASTTGCTACTGTQVLQSGACAECPAGSVQSADKLSCVAQSTCSTQYGPGSQEVTPGTCRCTASGFAGNDNTVCVDCLRIGKVVSGTAGSTTCEPCSGTEVLQSGSCSECPNSLVPSADKLSCVSCASRYGEASTFVSFGLCRCTAFGFAGSDNSVCSDCLRMGQMISGATCSSCSGTQVLQAGVCAECPADFVPSSDKQSCISCSQRYGNGAVYSSINSCICDSTSGFAGAANSACAYCWILGKTVSGNSCIACSGTAVLQSGVCSECQANFVPSADKLSCVTCASKFGDGSVFLSTGICRCSDVLGFAGDDNAVCSDCWRQGKSVSGTAGSTTCLSCSGTQVLQSGACADCPTNLVQSADKLSCVTCASLYGQGSSYSAINTCVCRVSEGFGGANNHVCEDCKRSGKEASTTGCTACTGTQVLQSGACAECPAGSVQSADKLSCVAQSTCSTQYGPGSQEVTPGTCRCTASGFAGNDNTVCVDCLRIGKVVSGTAGSTTCEPCSGTQVLQSGSCSECPNSLVPSADKLSCVSCASRYGEASTFVSFGLCRCTAFGFAGSDNSVCSDCLRMGQMISGATCSSCSGTQVLQAGVCAECPADFVPSSDKQSCISCSQRYGNGAVYSSINSCICDSTSGFAGAANSACAYCWILGKTVSGNSCIACSGTAVLQSGVCSECQANFVPSADKLSCVTCASKFGDGSVFLSSGICRCSGVLGFAGDDNAVCSDCWRQGKSVSGTAGSTTCLSCSGTQVLQSGACADCPTNLVQSADKLSCVTCASLYGQGSSYSAINTCVCRVSEGFGGANNHVCEDCKRSGKEASTTGCTACTGTQVLQSGACAECPAGSVQSADKLSCVAQSTCSTQYGPGSQEVTPGTCRCTASGFAGNDNTVCVDCLRIGKVVSGTAGSTTCEPCSGTEVLQSGSCSECPNSLVPSADKLSCVSCASRYGEASTFVSFGLCRCTAFGFAGSDNSVCSDCLRMGQMISGATCSSCSGTQVLQAGVCAECPADFVPSSDKQSCISCSQRYGNGAVYSSINSCICDSTSGFAGAANSACAYCWILGKTVSGNSCIACSGTAVLQSGVCSECPTNFVPSSDKLSCISCAQRYGQGSIYSTINTCVCDQSTGFAGSSNSACTYCWVLGKTVSGSSCAVCSGTTVLQSGACAECPADFVPSSDKLSCISCSQRYGDGSTYSAVGTCVCDSSNGFTALTQNSICTDCWRQGKTVSGNSCASCALPLVLQQGACAQCSNDLVPSADGLSCVTCSSRYGSGSAFLSFGNCRCSAPGFAGNDNQICVDCLRVGQIVTGTAGATTCASCPNTQVLQSGTCTECPTNFVPSSDKLYCVACSTKYGYGSTFAAQNQCKCTVDGFAGADNNVCVDCWRLGKVVSGSQCVSCPPPQIFQQGTCQDVAVAVTCPGTEVFLGGKCQECPANYVPSLDKSTCVTCSSKFEYGSKYVQVGSCKCAQELGFYGADNNFCQDCWRNSQIIGQSGCTSCPSGRKFDPSTHTCESITTYVSQNQSGWKLGLAILSVIILLLIIGLVIWCLRMKKRLGQPRASSKLKKVTPMKATTLLNHSGFENDLKLQQLQSLASNKFDAKSKQDLEKQKQLERETKLQQSAEFKRLQQQKKDQESAEALKRKRETEQLKLSLQNQRLQQKLEAENAKRQNEERIRQLKLDQENSLKLQRQEQLRQIETDKINKQKQLEEEQLRKQRELEQEQLKMQKQLEEEANRKLESERLEKERLLKLQESLLNSKRSNFGSRIMNDRSGLDVVEIAWSERHKMKPQHLVKEVKLEPMNSGIKK